MCTTCFISMYNPKSKRRLLLLSSCSLKFKMKTSENKKWSQENGQVWFFFSNLPFFSIYHENKLIHFLVHGHSSWSTFGLHFNEGPIGFKIWFFKKSDHASGPWNPTMKKDHLPWSDFMVHGVNWPEVLALTERTCVCPCKIVLCFRLWKHDIQRGGKILFPTLNGDPPWDSKIWLQSFSAHVCVCLVPLISYGPGGKLFLLCNQKMFGKKRHRWGPFGCSLLAPH